MIAACYRNGKLLFLILHQLGGLHNSWDGFEFSNALLVTKANHNISFEQALIEMEIEYIGFGSLRRVIISTLPLTAFSLCLARLQNRSLRT